MQISSLDKKIFTKMNLKFLKKGQYKIVSFCVDANGSTTCVWHLFTKKLKQLGHKLHQEKDGYIYET